jgi:hypothetical protein
VVEFLVLFLLTSHAGTSSSIWSRIWHFGASPGHPELPLAHIVACKVFVSTKVQRVIVKKLSDTFLIFLRWSFSNSYLSMKEGSSIL